MAGQDVLYSLLAVLLNRGEYGLFSRIFEAGNGSPSVQRMIQRRVRIGGRGSSKKARYEQSKKEDDLNKHDGDPVRNDTSVTDECQVVMVVTRA